MHAGVQATFREVKPDCCSNVTTEGLLGLQVEVSLQALDIGALAVLLEMQQKRRQIMFDIVKYGSYTCAGHALGVLVCKHVVKRPGCVDQAPALPLYLDPLLKHRRENGEILSRARVDPRRVACNAREQVRSGKITRSCSTDGRAALTCGGEGRLAPHERRRQAPGNKHHAFGFSDRGKLVRRHVRSCCGLQNGEGALKVRIGAFGVDDGGESGALGSAGLYSCRGLESEGAAVERGGLRWSEGTKLVLTCRRKACDLVPFEDGADGTVSAV